MSRKKSQRRNSKKPPYRRLFAIWTIRNYKFLRKYGLKRALSVWYIKERLRVNHGIAKMKQTGVRNAEFLFGIQALLTGILSSIKYTIDDVPTNPTNLIFMLIASIASIPQIYAVLADRLHLRHWSNLATFLSAAMHSIALYLGGGETIAIFGYAGLSAASLYCFTFTAKIIKLKKNAPFQPSSTPSY